MSVTFFRESGLRESPMKEYEILSRLARGATTEERQRIGHYVEIARTTCHEAKHVVFLDGDLKTDGMVDCFVQGTL